MHSVVAVKGDFSSYRRVELHYTIQCDDLPNSNKRSLSPELDQGSLNIYSNGSREPE